MRGWIALACALALSLAATASPAQPSAGATEEADAAAWVERLSQARAGLVEARERVAAAESAYRDWRQRHYPRGAKKAELLAEMEAAAAALAEAEEAYPRLLEEARRAGAPPGVLRDFEEP